MSMGSIRKRSLGWSPSLKRDNVDTGSVPNRTREKTPEGVPFLKPTAKVNDAVIAIPPEFMNATYRGGRFPGAPGVSGLTDGANCHSSLQPFDKNKTKKVGF